MGLTVALQAVVIARVREALQGGRPDDARAALEEALREEPAAAWAHVELARLAWSQDRDVAIAHLRQAIALQPDHVTAKIALAQGLTQKGLVDGAYLQEAAELIVSVLPQLPASAKTLASGILWRCGLYAEAEGVGSFAELGRLSATQNKPGELLGQFARIKTDADRIELLHQHQLWARPIEEAAAKTPLSRPSRRTAGARRRLGILSADLRHHVVAFFAQPLIQYQDERFELFCYVPTPRPADYVTERIARSVSAFRHLPTGDHRAAEIIAADELDMLIDLSGPLASRPGILAHKPAPLLASWLGYPHSIGLSAVDYFIADPYLAPARPELLLERPLLMPASWISMTPEAFQPEPHVQTVPPLERNGHVTFGTANDAYKYNPLLLRTWARVLAAVPASRFMIVRPEAGARWFQESVARHFAEEGVAAHRLDFRPVRGAVRQLYGEMDIALDTFPLTGGTTTCEALWMGVPTVSLVGEAVFERLSWSILNNAGLADLAAHTLDEYVRIAVELAGAPDRLARLRRTMRDEILARPLGQPRRFAQDFYDLMAQAIAA